MKTNKYFSLANATEHQRAERAEIAGPPQLVSIENMYVSQPDGIMSLRGDMIDHVTNVTTEASIILGAASENYDFINSSISQGIIEDDIYLTRVFPRYISTIMCSTYSTGLATFTSGSAMVILSGATWIGNVWPGCIIKSALSSKYFKIKAMASTTVIYLEDGAADDVDFSCTDTYIVYKTHSPEFSKYPAHLELFNDTYIYNFPLIADPDLVDVTSISGPFYRVRDSGMPTNTQTQTPIGASKRIATITVDTAGTGYTEPPTVTFTGGDGTGAVATAVLTGTTLGSIIDDYAWGNGVDGFPLLVYSGADTSVNVAGGGASVDAEVSMTTSGRFLYRIRGNRGSGYTVSPTLTVEGDGTGATVECTVANGKIASITITNPGYGYTYCSISQTGGDGTGATFLPELYPAGTLEHITSITVDSPGTGYTGLPTLIPDRITGTKLSSNIYTETATTYDYALTTGLYGTTPVPVLTATSVDTVTIDNPGTGFTSAPAIGFDSDSGADATATATIEDYTIYTTTNTITAPTVATSTKFTPLSSGYRSQAFCKIDLYIILLGTSEYSGGIYVLYPRRLRYTVPDTYNDFSGDGSGYNDLPGTGFLMDARTLQDIVVIAESGGISILTTTGDSVNPFNYRMIKEGCRTISNLCMAGGLVFFIREDGRLMSTDGVQVVEASPAFDFSQHEELNDGLPVQLVYNRHLDSLQCFKHNPDATEHKCYNIGLTNGSVSHYKVPILANSNWPKCVVQSLSAYEEHGA